MKEVSAAEVLKRLQQHRAAGLHVDSRLIVEVTRPGNRYLVDLEAAEDFWDLVWQSNDDTRPLAPVGLPRTLRHCALRVSSFGWSFQTLAAAGYPWFKRCVSIDECFSHSKLGWITLTPLTESERRETPGGTHYIYDGLHKAIVLAKRLLRNELEYRPLEALLLTPRRT